MPWKLLSSKSLAHHYKVELPENTLRSARDVINNLSHAWRQIIKGASRGGTEPHEHMIINERYPPGRLDYGWINYPGSRAAAQERFSRVHEKMLKSIERHLRLADPLKGTGG